MKKENALGIVLCVCVALICAATPKELIREIDRLAELKKYFRHSLYYLHDV